MTKPTPEQADKEADKKKSVTRRGPTVPRLRLWWLLLLAFLLQGLASYAGPLKIPESVVPWLVPLSYLVLAAGAAVNMRYWGFRFFLVGLCLNLVVMALNGWRMPITPDALIKAGFPAQASLPSGSYLDTIKSVLLLKQQTKLWFLSDIFVAAPIHTVFSIGDAIIILSASVVIMEVILAWRRVASIRRSLSRESVTE